MMARLRLWAACIPDTQNSLLARFPRLLLW
jgi:hypothetical protein